MLPELHFPWLECSVLLPLIGSLVCGLIQDRNRAQRVAVALGAVTLFCTIGEWIDFALVGTFQAHDHWDVLQMIFRRDNIFVIDELSAPLLPLTALLYLMTMLSTLRTKIGRFSFGLTLLSESIVLATLSCHDPWVMITLLSLAVVPPWVELKRRGASTRVFLIHMGLFIVLLVLGRLLLGKSDTPEEASGIAAGLLTMAALLRAGVVPVHCWMTDLFDKASFGTALLFVAPMTGAYAVMHLVFPVVPGWAMRSIAVLSLITAVYSAGMASIQVDARRFFCYLFLSNSSLVLSGLELVNEIGMTGALCVWISVGLSLGGFALTIRSVEARIGRLRLDRYHGMYEHTPTLAGLFLLTGLASIGFPGTIGFIGMELLIEGAVDVYPLVGFAVVLAAALNSISILRGYFRIFTGQRFTTSVMLRSRAAERFAVVVLTILVLGGGLWPQPGVASRHHAAVELMKMRHVTPTGESETELNVQQKPSETERGDTSESADVKTNSVQNDSSEKK